MEKEKRLGQVFTPHDLVVTILDIADYTERDGILGKHVIDNSCGDGAFLVEVVRRYCTAHRHAHANTRRAELTRQLGEFIHGIEIDPGSHRSCLRNLDALAEELGLPKVEWDVRLADALETHAFDGRMDFVVGNPPYVRVHNLDAAARIKRYSFCGGGMTDLYLVFYELGLKMLAPNGRLCYITPSSWTTSVAGRGMRNHIQRTGCLRGIVDLQHFQPFAATAYTAITLLAKGKTSDSFTYGVYEHPRRVRAVATLPYNAAFFDGALFLGDRKTLRTLKAVKTGRAPAAVEVKNGFATLADDIFISDTLPFSRFTIPVVKASTGKWTRAFYPYDRNGKALPKETVLAERQVADYLLCNKKSLLKGRRETEHPEWFLYGRTQALKDVWTRKYAINTVVRDVPSIKFTPVSEGAGVYSGLYILTDVSEDRLRSALLCDDFIHYVSSLRKYKSGGYYTFSSRDLKQYLDYRLQHLLKARDRTGRRQMELPLD